MTESVADRRAGISMVELVVALTLLSVGMLGVAGTAGLIARTARMGQLRSRIAVLAGSEMERLLAAARREPLVATGSRRAGRAWIEWAADSTELRVGVRLSEGPREEQRVLESRLGRW